MNFMAVKRVLFVCVENAGRSQMAEAFFNKYAPKSFQAISAGTKPTIEINQTVKQAMSEIGIELCGKPKMLTDDVYDKIVNMGCIDKTTCPVLNSEDWNMPDPKEKSLHEVRIIRSQIESKVMELISCLEK